MCFRSSISISNPGGFESYVKRRLSAPKDLRELKRDSGDLFYVERRFLIDRIVQPVAE